MIDKTLKGGLKSVKTMVKMAVDVTEKSLEVTTKSLNVMEQAAMEAAEKTVQHSKEMAKLVRLFPTSCRKAPVSYHLSTRRR
jgi:hypothetical protein